MTETPALKPCPFCEQNGDNLRPQDSDSHELHWIFCLRCECEGPVGNTPAEAIAAWNKRSVGSAPKPDEGGSIAPNPSLAPVSEEVVNAGMVRAALARAYSALDEAECILDVEQHVETYAKVTAARKFVGSVLSLIPLAHLPESHKALKGGGRDEG